VLDPSGGRTDLPRVLVVLERNPHAAGGRVVVVLGAGRSSTLARALNEAAAGGFELITAGAARGELLAVLRRK
jgi:hypothetical protein